jgi:uncharacterized protein
MKSTVVIGASTNPSRYSFLAAQKLVHNGHDVHLIGRHGGQINGQNIYQNKEHWDDVDTVTLYINPQHQVDYYDYIISLNPKRVIFNPGTENPQLEDILSDKKIVPVRACTLVLLATGQY